MVLTSVCIGDLMVDTVVIAEADDLATGAFGVLFRPVDLSVGGNAVFFAQAAKDVGFENSIVMGSVGGDEYGLPDAAGKLLLDALSSAGIDTMVEVARGTPTGQAVLIYTDRDTRLLFAERGANVHNHPEFESVRALLRSADILHLSGYMAVELKQREWLVGLLKAVCGLNVRVALDLAPHNIGDMISSDVLEGILSLTDYISCELATLRRLFGEPETDNAGLLHEFVREALPCAAGTLIRLNAESDFLWSEQAGWSIFRVPYSEGRASLRFTDRVFARQLAVSLAQ